MCQEKEVNMTKKIQMEPLDRFLTFDAIRKGFALTWWPPELYSADSVILTRHGQEVYRWEYAPSLGEVFEKCQELMEVH